MKKNLLILGAGQYGSVVKEIAQDMGCFEKISFLDDKFGEDNPDYHEESIGKIGEMTSFCGEYSYAIPAIGNPDVRLSLIKRIEEETTFQIPVIASPKAYISDSAQIQKGCVIEPLAGVHANTVVGFATFVSMGAVVNHNAFVSQGCHVDNNAVVKSGALVPPKTKIEAGSVFLKAGNVPDLNADWVGRYIAENGHAPSFF